MKPRKCPVCGAPVKLDRLDRHIADVHPPVVVTASAILAMVLILGIAIDRLFRSRLMLRAAWIAAAFLLAGHIGYALDYAWTALVYPFLLCVGPAFILGSALFTRSRDHRMRAGGSATG